MVKFSLVIQAGGKSSRMGRDKGLLPFEKGTLLGFILDQVKELGDEQFIVSNQTKDYRQFGLPVYPDVIPDMGALGGIYSALYHASNPLVLLLACDMPFVNIGLLDYLLSHASGHDVVIPQLKESEFAEPFRAVYSTNCLQPIKNALENGRRRVIDFWPDVSVLTVGRDIIHRYDPQEISFFNINTPDDLRTAHELLKVWQDLPNSQEN